MLLVIGGKKLEEIIMRNYDPRNYEGYQNTDHFKKLEFMKNLKEKMLDYPERLSIDALYHYAPFELKEEVGEAIETDSLASTFCHGEEMVEKQDFILWCAEEITERRCAYPVY